jgi:hypothetical protein
MEFHQKKPRSYKGKVLTAERLERDAQDWEETQVIMPSNQPKHS